MENFYIPVYILTHLIAYTKYVYYFNNNNYNSKMDFE